jgi:hypothetical protein
MGNENIEGLEQRVANLEAQIGAGDAPRTTHGDPGGQVERRLRDVEWRAQQQEGVGGERLDDSGTIVDGGVTQWHSWRVAQKKTAGVKSWCLVNGDDDAEKAGSVWSPSGTETLLDSEWHTYSGAVSGWLKVSVTVADGSMEAEIVTSEPTADPFNTTTAVFVFPLFSISTDGSVTEFQSSDISLEGLLSFDDSDPADLGEAAEPGSAGSPARADHVHKVPDGLLPEGGTEAQVLQRDSVGAAVWDDVRMTI